MTTEDILEQRGSRYGTFKDQAQLVQGFKQVMENSLRWNDLKPYQKEALEMIQHKISRMLNGDPMYLDNVEDILGYGKLMLDQMKLDLEKTRTPSLLEEDDVNN